MSPSVEAFIGGALYGVLSGMVAMGLGWFGYAVYLTSAAGF